MVGTMTVVNGDTFAVEQVITTQPTARTLALDSVRHILYAVALYVAITTTYSSKVMLVELAAVAT